MALFVLFAALYAPSIGNDFVWDSKGLILEDTNIRDIRNIPSFFTGGSTLSDNEKFGYDEVSVGSIIYYRPLMNIFHALEYSIFGKSAAPYKATNVILNSLVTVMAFLLVRRLTLSDRLALIAALVYGVNPARTETVCWVHSDSSILMALLVFTSLYLYAGRSYRLSIALFGLGLLVRESAILLIPVVFMYELLLNKDAGIKKFTRPALFALIAVIYLIVRRLAVGPIPMPAPELGPIAWANSIALMIKGYLKIFIMPDAPVTFYPLVPKQAAPFSSEVALSWLVLLVAIAATFRLWRRGRGDLAFWALWFVIFIATGFNVGAYGEYFMAEKMLYVSSLGLSVLAATAISSTSLKHLYLPAVLVVAILFTHGAATLKRIPYWKDTVTYLGKLIEFEPTSYLMHYALGHEYATLGKETKALEHFQRTAELKPQLSAFVTRRSSNMYNAMAQKMVAGGDYTGALGSYEKSLAIAPSQPRVLSNMGNALFMLARHEEAMERWRQAITMEPGYEEPYYNMGYTLETLGRTKEAIEYYKQFMALSPALPPGLADKIKTLEKQ